jgi:protein-tyrosine-phosphatase
VDFSGADLVVNMTGIPGKTLFQPHVAFEDWEIDDPYQEDLSVYSRICDDIQKKVLDLAARLRTRNGAAPTA